MNIVYLVENATGIWGGVKVVFQQANLLTARGHAVTILSKSEAPGWFQLDCDFRTVPDFEPHNLPNDADLVVGTFWTTVPFAMQAPSGRAVHLVQGYEGDNSSNANWRAQIEAIYQDASVPRVTISRHLHQVVQQRFNQDSHLVRYIIDHDTMYANHAPRRRAGDTPLRIGLVGPCDVDWKDIPTGLAACELAHRAGLNLQLVRVTNTAPQPCEQNLSYPVEWHVQARPEQMGEIYRSLDVFVGTSRGNEEGFFLPAVEAMACGIPTVLTDIPCFRGYGEGQYALFVDAGDAAGMAEALVLASSHPTIQTELRQNGLEIAKQYTPQNHITDLERAFASIAGVSPTQPQVTSSPSAQKGDELAQLSTHLVMALQAAAGAFETQDRIRAIRYLEAADHIQPGDPTIQQQLRDLRSPAMSR